MDAISTILKKILSSRPKLKEHLLETRIVELWESAVGPTLAKHAKAVNLKEGKLWVEVSSPVWKHELHLMKSVALEKLKTKIEEEMGSAEKDRVQDLFFLNPLKKTNKDQKELTTKNQAKAKSFPRKF